LVWLKQGISKLLFIATPLKRGNKIQIQEALAKVYLYQILIQTGSQLNREN